MYEFRHMLYPILKQRFGKGDTFMQNYFSPKDTLYTSFETV